MRLHHQTRAGPTGRRGTGKKVEFILEFCPKFHELEASGNTLLCRTNIVAEESYGVTSYTQLGSLRECWSPGGNTLCTILGSR